MTFLEQATANYVCDTCGQVRFKRQCEGHAFKDPSPTAEHTPSPRGDAMNLENLTTEEVRAIQIADIRARLAARTQGSWIATLDNDGWCVSSVPDEGAPTQRIRTLARLCSGSPASDTSDACFIASAPDDIAILLAEVERLTSECDASHRTGIDRMQQAIIDILQAHNAPADFIARIVEMEYP